MMKTANWIEDLRASRNLSRFEISSFEYVFTWFEGWVYGVHGESDRPYRDRVVSGAGILGRRDALP